jgi:hypothetical protein
MPFFAVCVGAKSYFYIVAAESSRKAEQSVRRYLKAAGQNNAADVVTAIPARHLPCANAPHKKGVVIAWPTARKVYRQRMKTRPRA